MGKLSFGRVLHCFCLSSSGSGSCLCINNYASEDENELESKPLITHEAGHLVKIKDVISAPPTLALQLKPKNRETSYMPRTIGSDMLEFMYHRFDNRICLPAMVVLRVSMHCNGCARKVKKHISKMEGVTSYEVDLESKTVVLIGDIVPFEVLESVSKVKTAELWPTPAC